MIFMGALSLGTWAKRFEMCPIGLEGWAVVDREAGKNNWDVGSRELGSGQKPLACGRNRLGHGHKVLGRAPWGVRTWS